MCVYIDISTLFVYIDVYTIYTHNIWLRNLRILRDIVDNNK